MPVMGEHASQWWAEAVCLGSGSNVWLFYSCRSRLFIVQVGAGSHQHGAGLEPWSTELTVMSGSCQHVAGV